MERAAAGQADHPVIARFGTLFLQLEILSLNWGAFLFNSRPAAARGYFLSIHHEKIANNFSPLAGC